MRLSEGKLQKLSDIASDLGTVTVAAVALPAMLDKFNPLTAIGGFVISSAFWLTSIWLVKN